MRIGSIENRLNCVETQTVEAKLFEPVAGIVEDESTHDRVAVIRSVSPRRRNRARKVIRRISPKVIAGRTEVVVDDVEQHREPELVGSVDELAELIRASVWRVRG